MKNILIIANVWPEPTSSAAGGHMMQLIETLQRFDVQITFTCTSVPTQQTVDLNHLGIHVQQIKMNTSEFDIFTSELDPSIVVFDRFMTEEQFGWRIAESCPNAIRILNMEDLHSLRYGREQALKHKTEFSDHFLYNDKAKREIASILRCDLSLIISEAEMKVLKESFNVSDDLLMYFPFLLDPITETIQQELPDFNERGHFMTIGNFLHPPNYDAVVQLKESIWPLIRSELPAAEIHIYGAYMLDKVKQLENTKEGFIIKGFTEDVNEVMRTAKVCLAPLRFGAGLKGKLIDAMRNGTPCVMSSIASEGLFGHFKANGFVADDPETFARKAIELYENESIWDAKRKLGFEVINSRYHKPIHQNNFIERIEALKKGLVEHRHKNFIGAILQHHQLQSTKYMSKWIEAKNKNI